jgi:hypothetical protein
MSPDVIDQQVLNFFLNRDEERKMHYTDWEVHQELDISRGAAETSLERLALKGAVKRIWIEKMDGGYPAWVFEPTWLNVEAGSFQPGMRSRPSGLAERLSGRGLFRARQVLPSGL